MGLVGGQAIRQAHAGAGNRDPARTTDRRKRAAHPRGGSHPIGTQGGHGPGHQRRRDSVALAHQRLYARRRRGQYRRHSRRPFGKARSRRVTAVRPIRSGFQEPPSHTADARSRHCDLAGIPVFGAELVGAGGPNESCASPALLLSRAWLRGCGEPVGAIGKPALGHPAIPSCSQRGSLAGASEVCGGRRESLHHRFRRAGPTLAGHTPAVGVRARRNSRTGDLPPRGNSSRVENHLPIL